MDQANHRQMNQTYCLLALCARAEGHPTFYEQLENQVRTFTEWDELPAQAELHGMAPLLWHHFRQAGIGFPTQTEHTLRGLYLRHRSLNQAHTATLVDIQRMFEQAGIQPVVLKGLALAYKYYPDPALRPVSDLDLLLHKEDMMPALRILAEAGYQVRFPDPSLHVLTGELTADSPKRNGISTHIELHHYNPARRQSKDFMLDDELKEFNEPPQELIIEGCAIYTPSYMDTLRHLTRHMVRHLFAAQPDKPLSLKWSADIISLVEQHAEDIDWEKMWHSEIDILKRLTVLYSMTPLPKKYKALMPVREIDPPAGVNRYLHGWPHTAFSKRQVGLWHFISLTFQTPSAWWLQLYYGIDKRDVFWYGNVIYRLRVLRMMSWTILHHKFLKQQ